MTQPQTRPTPPFAASTRGSRGARGCPQCCGPTARVARTLPDRVLSLWMPVKRYRCCAAHCNWEGLLLSRRQHKAAANDAKSTLSGETELLPESAPTKQPALIAFRSRTP